MIFLCSENLNTYLDSSLGCGNYSRELFVEMQ
jgi:hypothetical protein